MMNIIQLTQKPSAGNSRNGGKQSDLIVPVSVPLEISKLVTCILR